MAVDLPSVSIVTPSYNQAAFLERTLKSVLDQGYPRLEYFVLDGGSTDGSADIIRRYANRLTYWASEKDGGQAAVVNVGWQRASGEILGWINSDDYYLPGTLAFVGEYFATHPECRFLYGGCAVVDPEGVEHGFVGEPYRRATMLRGRQPMAQPSTFIRRSLALEVGLVDPTLQYSMDYDFFLKAALRSAPVFVDRTLAAFTVHPNAKTSRYRGPSRRETYRVALRYAQGSDRIAIRLLDVRSRAFHALPSAIRRRIDARRESPIIF